ncbi:ComEC/Rec2 family competence protein [Labrys okinawensis]|uniref:ComEC/Rec2 family competence protein n=1 Tax=Labrys okinawensis TaxID=346911 RepID=UPI0039BD02EA
MSGNDRARVRVGVLGGRGGEGSLVLPGAEGVGQVFGNVLAWLAKGVAAEVAAFELALVVPIFLGLGVIAYFAAPDEPSLTAPLIATCVVTAAAYSLRGRWWPHVALVCLAAIGVGFCSAKLRTMSVATPQLARSLSGNVTGLVLSVESRLGDSARVVMRPVAIEGLSAEATPGQIRLTLRRAGDLKAGDSITVKAVMRPPPPPALPGGYDFARDAFFDGIGAVGFVAGKIAPAAAPIEPGYAEAFNIWIDTQRNRLTARIVEAVPGENGAIAASQVTGKRGEIPNEANDALRASGLYHVVSISGLHMALFAGGLFALIRALLALSRRVVLYRGAKEIAAMLSLAPAAAYTLFSGAEVATVRSFVMTAIVLLAVALGRSAITRRNVALAASFVLLTTPEQLLGPSFQMSFAAVAMLVAAHDAWGKRKRTKYATFWERGIASGLGILLAMMLTTLVASLATAPFSAYHFHRLTMQSLASNLVATPIVSFLMMPLALLAVLAEPFGYGAFFWHLMGWSVGLFMQVARYVATWPGSDLVLPQFSSVALCLFSLTLVLLTLMRGRLAVFTLVPLFGGIAAAATTPTPVAIFGANGHAALVRKGDSLTSLANRSDNFAVQQWLLAMGDRRKPDDPSLAEQRLCDKEGCSAPIEGGDIFMLDHTLNAAQEDCGHVSVLAGPVALGTSCAGRGIVLNRDLIFAAGSVALYADRPTERGGETRWRVVTARDLGSSRPWAPMPAWAAKVSVPAPAASTQTPDADSAVDTAAPDGDD